MTGTPMNVIFPTPTIVPLGDSALLVRFGTALTDPANRAAIALASLLHREPVAGVLELAPGLVSVLLRFDPLAAGSAAIEGELRLRLFGLANAEPAPVRDWTIPVHFDGLDIDAVASALDMSAAAFITAHNARPLRVLATGFAPGFVYCGLHPDSLLLPRRAEVRPMVPAGTVLFAASQTAITATELPTGWHIIGRADFSNFDPAAAPPTQLSPGDNLSFTVAS
ncbi:MAG: 5-oxoprolinase subunit B family protein [Devosia sp.]